MRAILYLTLLLWGAFLSHPSQASLLSVDDYAPEARTMLLQLDDCIEEVEKFTESAEDDESCSTPIDLQQLCGLFYQSYQSSSLKNVMTPLDTQSNTRSLLDLYRLLETFENQFTQRYQASKVTLSKIAESIYVPQPETSTFLGWWEIFLEWLKSTQSDNLEFDTSWLEELVSYLQLSPETWEYIFYIMIAVIILMALAIIINELRLSQVRSLFNIGSKRHFIQHPGDGQSQLKQQYHWDKLAKMDTKIQIIYLWNMILAHLQQQTNLQINEALTNREIIRSLKSLSSQHEQEVSELSAWSEAVLYGGLTLTEDQLRHARSTTRKLLAN